ncbi:SGNH/GDSL hydrolase family protein [Aridibaculum aurantiacum]|uniref:SGNH/GDSL hydrolase family protein n=1 Tax=Aridibaculum aurantiacum TaxID=2810307 RepID=UPI001A968619|nr:SGNH/GDSL hydrolase family protein [Aridibaculum aurantiacum]
MSNHIHSYLALGDSYTIGESLPIFESFPYQVVQMLRKKNMLFHAAEIVAKTGWTTFELAEHLIHTQLNQQYDFVTLLIGVNNQYRGLSAKDYEADFEFLLKKAVHLAGDKADHVIVLSIPDWGATPFAEGRDKEKIASEIDAFNSINERISKLYSCQYINITPGTREAANDASLVAADKLHPSAKEYERWAAQVAEVVEGRLVYKLIS